ncbi:transferases folic acid binding [Euphorbia peplus]|nr:transferases folic acid binding [Euphorbia peplus]
MDFNSSCKTKIKNNANNSRLLCCKLFISESRNRAALNSLETAARTGTDLETLIVNQFDDRAYNRIRYTLVSHVVVDSGGNQIYSPLLHTLLAMIEAAYETIYLESHHGAHPRLGVVDDIVCHLRLHWMMQLGLLRHLLLILAPDFKCQ